ncbi:MAG: methylisocitrate lyase [Nitrospiria bacterium]
MSAREITSPGRRFRQLLQKRNIILPGAFNALSALLIERSGFEAVYLSGAGLANGVAGLPDIGLLTLTEVITQVQHITQAVKIPAIADADTGFGEGLHLLRALSVFESADVAGIQIEDQQFPKRCGHLSGKSLINEEDMVRKIQILVKERQDPDFLIIARTDARGVTGLDDAIQRACAYRHAGADIIFPEALKSAEEFSIFARSVKGLLLANMTEFGQSPALPAEALFALGYRIVLFPMTLFRLAAKSMETGLAVLKQNGTSKNMLDKMQKRDDLYHLLHYDVFEKED